MTTAARPGADPILLEAEKRRREKARVLGPPDAAPPRFPKARGRHEATPIGDARAEPAPEHPTEKVDDWHDEDAAIEQMGELDETRPGYRATCLPDEAVIVAAYLSVSVGNVAKHATKWLALFRIIECEAAPEVVGLEILRSWNAPKRGWMSPKHALSRDFSAVCKLPLRSLPPSLSPNAILGSFLRGVWVRAATHLVTEYVDARSRQIVKREPWEHYSVIESIDGVAAGSPRPPRFQKEEVNPSEKRVQVTVKVTVKVEARATVRRHGLRERPRAVANSLDTHSSVSLRGERRSGSLGRLSPETSRSPLVEIWLSA